MTNPNSPVHLRPISYWRKRFKTVQTELHEKYPFIDITPLSDTHATVDIVKSVRTRHTTDRVLDLYLNANLHRPTIIHSHICSEKADGYVRWYYLQTFSDLLDRLFERYSCVRGTDVVVGQLRSGTPTRVSSLASPSGEETNIMPVLVYLLTKLKKEFIKYMGEIRDVLEAKQL